EDGAGNRQFIERLRQQRDVMKRNSMLAKIVHRFRCDGVFSLKLVFVDDRFQFVEGVVRRHSRHVPAQEFFQPVIFESVERKVHGDYCRLMRLATTAAPKPLSIFTTATFDAQLFNMPKSAAIPLKLAPYPTLVGTAM